MSLKYDLIKDTKRITVMENHWKGDRGVGIADVSGRTLENMEDEKYIYKTILASKEYVLNYVERERRMKSKMKI